MLTLIHAELAHVLIIISIVNKFAVFVLMHKLKKHVPAAWDIIMLMMYAWNAQPTLAVLINASVLSIFMIALLDSVFYAPMRIPRNAKPASAIISQINNA